MGKWLWVGKGEVKGTERGREGLMVGKGREGLMVGKREVMCGKRVKGEGTGEDGEKEAKVRVGNGEVKCGKREVKG